jgi:hypothetical protein
MCQTFLSVNEIIIIIIIIIIIFNKNIIHTILINVPIFYTDRIRKLFSFARNFHNHIEIVHYATNRQVANSIPDGVIGIFL